MLKDAINRVLELHEIAGHVWTDEGGNRWTDRGIRRIENPEQVPPTPLALHTLTGLRDYAHNSIKEPGAYLLVVQNHKHVSLVGGLQPENDNRRFCYAEAKMDLHGYEFNKWVDLESFVIALQSHFVPTKPVEEILTYLGKLASENVREQKDDGFSQSIEIRVGVRAKENVTIKNPIVLQPWRTFREVAQPSSSCILRLRDSGGMQCALFVADGNTWQLAAIENIKKWLGKEIPGIPVVA